MNTNICDSIINISIIYFFLVTPSANEPITGWTDNYYGPTWMTIHSMLGYLRVHNGDDNVRTNIIPVDITINALIASAWDVFNQQSRCDHHYH